MQFNPYLNFDGNCAEAMDFSLASRQMSEPTRGNT